MAVLGRLLVSSAERLDLPDFLSIDSFTQGDFKYLMRSFVGGDNPYILTGFDVINPGAAIGTQNISIRVADSVVYYPGSLAGPFFHGLEEGNSQAAPLVPELRKNSTNYVYLTLTTSEAAKDTRAFWDPDKEGGVGGEFTQDVNTQSVLSADINVSVSAFPENTVPVCKVVVGANFIESIEDARDMMFRLGSGGLNPNPLATYQFRSEPSSTYARTEPNTLMSNSLDPNAFQGGDKNIKTLKEWMDVVMTKLLELSGTTYWYEDTASFSLIEMFKDALATSIKSKGVWQSSDSTPGLLTWTEDIVLQSVSDNKDIIIRDGNKTLLDGQVMYIDQNRGEEINTGAVAVEWFNGTNYVNGSLGSFESLTKGDWIKKAGDPDYRYLRVEEFYAAANLAGGVTSAGNALSVKLSDTYGGISEIKQGVYVQGEYLTTDVQVGDRSDVALTDAGGDLYWLAMRSDKIMDISDITTTSLTIDIENHDGTRARCTSVGHGLIDKQRITITGSTNFDGVHQVEVETSDVFYIYVSGGPHADELAQSAFFATVTTEARTTDNGYELESANHTFDLDQKVILANTTNYNGTYQVFPLTDTTFSIPVPSAIANESDGTATSVDIYVRTDLGPTKLSQGENKGIGEVESENIMSFIGMDNASQTYPTYHIPPSYNTLDGFVNFNSDITDNLTQRVSKLTAMMADKAQDKTIQFVPVDVDTITSTTNVGAQDITFASLSGGTPTLNVQMMGSDNDGTLDLTSTISLNASQVAYIDVDRNDGFALGSATVVDLADMPVGENIFVIAFRLLGTTIYLWDGSVVLANNTIEYKSHEKAVIRQNSNLELIEGETWAWDLGTNTLSWGTDAYIQVPGVDKTRNTIQAGSVMLTVDGQAAYVDINRNTGAVANLTVNTADISTLTLPNPNRIVIAQRIGDEVIVRGNKLALAGLAESAFQNVNLKLIEGGTWSWEVSGVNELTSSADAYVQVPGLTKERNTILAQTITLTADDQVAYVSINRDSGVADNLAVTVIDEASVPTGDDIIIIARRTGGDVIVGTSSFALKSESFLELDGALAEIDRYHGQLAVKPSSTPDTKIRISGSDIAKLSGSTLSLEQKNLLLSFDGAVIDFATGEVFESDGVTPFLGGINDFTPFAIPASEYFWYSVSVLPNTANADNTISGQILVIPATASNAVLASAPKAPFPGSGIKLANVYVQESGGGIANIDYDNLITLGVGGSGSGGTGDANADLTRYQDRLNLSPFEYANTNIASVDEDSQLDGSSTATYDIPTGNFKFLDSTADTLISTQQLDTDFLDEGIDISTVELFTIWDLDSIDTSATYELSRDGGGEWQSMTMNRIGNSDSYRGLHTFADEASNAFNQEYAVANADSLKDLDDTSAQAISQKFTVAATTVYKNVITYINRNNLDSVGKFCVEIVSDDAGAPSTDPNDVVWTSPIQNVTDLAVGNNVVNISSQFVVVAGDYHMIIKTDDEYKTQYTADNTDKISVRMDSSAGPTPNLRTYNGTVWSAEVADETMVYRLEGRVLDVRVRITSSATADDKFLSSYGLFYKYEDGIEFTRPVFRELFRFDGTVDNLNEFTLTNFLPDSRLLMCFALGNGQVFRYGDFVLDGHKVIFPENTFNIVGDVELEFFQMQGVDGIASTVADALLTANHLGSSDASIDKSVAGRGIILKRPDGTLREITINDDDEIEIWSVDP